MDKNRLEAFSDGVLAIIITIMILELGLPAGGKLKDLIKLKSVLNGYFLSFMFIATYWVNHHITFHDSKIVNLKILWCNIIWLFVMSFIPFTTAWAGKYPVSVAPVSVYFGDMALASISFHVMYFFIVREKGERFTLNLRSIVSLVVYTLASALGWLCPTVAYVVVSIINLWWVFPYNPHNKQDNKQD